MIGVIKFQYSIVDGSVKSPKSVTPAKAGVQNSSRPLIKYGVNSSRELSQRLDPGIHREPWIPAFAGMTPFWKPLVYGQTPISGTKIVILSEAKNHAFDIWN